MSRIYWIALNTFRESIRSKILYSVFFFAAVLVLLSTFFGSVAVGDQVVVIKDFGLFGLAFFTVAYTVIAGAALLHKELSRKTVLNILAKPVQRYEFLLGKYFGMAATVAVMLLLMAPALALYAALFEGRFDSGLLLAALFIFMQLLVVCALAILFSAIVVTPMLSGAFTFALFLAGRSTEYLQQLLQVGELNRVTAAILEAAYWLLPHLNLLDVSRAVVYNQPVTGAHFLWGLLYALSYSGVVLLLAVFCFRRREFL